MKVARFLVLTSVFMWLAIPAGAQQDSPKVFTNDDVATTPNAASTSATAQSTPDPPADAAAAKDPAPQQAHPQPTGPQAELNAAGELQSKLRDLYAGFAAVISGAPDSRKALYATESDDIHKLMEDNQHMIELLQREIAKAGSATPQ